MFGVEVVGHLEADQVDLLAWGAEARRPAAQERIVTAVDRELVSRGYVLAEVAAKADLWVVAHVLVDRQSLGRLADPDYWEFMTGITSVDTYALGAGTLVIDLVDRSSGTVLWRGLASESVSGPADKMMRKIDKSIHKMFRRFPPD